LSIRPARSPSPEARRRFFNSQFLITSGTAAYGVTDAKIAELIQRNFNLTPRGIIETLNLRRPIYRETARHGHFGRELPAFTWERINQAVLAALKKG
jgi:S-adenosylmethionine synthetase